jgi:hypothetical protein
MGGLAAYSFPEAAGPVTAAIFANLPIAPFRRRDWWRRRRWRRITEVTTDSAIARASTTTLRTVALTALAMLAFAANSLLCRLALQPPVRIDPASFGSVRLVSGALMLALVLQIRSGGGAKAAPTARPDWLAAAMLWAYVACFSFAYLTLTAGTGALILFGAVQLTMFSAGLYAGERLAALASVAILGGVALVLLGRARRPRLAG